MCEGSIGDWAEEVELQRRALALSAMAGAGGISAASAGEALGVVPNWATVARLQALQSLALKAPHSKELREALYNLNVAPVRFHLVSVVCFFCARFEGGG